MSKLSKHQILGLIVAVALIILCMPWLLHDTRQFIGLDPKLKFPEPPAAPLVDGDQQLPKQWVLQVASFSQQAQAATLNKQLQQDGFNSYIKTIHEEADSMQYLVVVGPLNTRAEARRVKQKLKTNLGSS